MKQVLPEVNALFSRDGMFTRWLKVAAALARAQAQLGTIPENVAEDIKNNAKLEKVDLEQYDDLYRKTGHPMVSMLKLLEVASGPESGQYIHLGATTQDVMMSFWPDLRSMRIRANTRQLSIRGRELIAVLC